MALRDGVVSLILRARNLMSKDTEEASESLSELRAEGEKLDKKLDDLGRQEAAIKGFDDTKRAADAATKELGRTVTEYERLRTGGRQAGQTQAEYALEVKQARTAQSLANTEYRKAQRELGRHVQTLNRAGIETDDLGDAEVRVQRELEETRRDLDRVNDEATRHARALGTASDGAGRFSGAVQGLRSKILGLVAGVGVFEALRRGIGALITTGGELEDLRLRLDGVFGSVKEGGRALEVIDEIAERNAQSLDATAESALRLKSFGIDPLNGSLQSLIDVNARYGEGAQSLSTVTTQLGQAWASGRLQLEELNSITDAGIPILRALEQITGRNAGQLREMASAGELGRDTLRQLIDEFGRMAEGAGAERINTINGLLTSLRKEFRDLLRTAAESGALDIFRSRLKDLLDTLRQAEEEGSVQRWARSLVTGLEAAATVSSKIVSVVRIGVNTVTSLWQAGAAAVTGSVSVVSGAISELAKLVGADGLGGQLDRLSEKSRDVASGFLDGVRQDGRDISAAFGALFDGITEDAQASADKQRDAHKTAQDEMLTASEARAAREKALAEAAAAEERARQLQQRLGAAATAQEIQSLTEDLIAAQTDLSRAKARQFEIDRQLEAEASEKASAAEIAAAERATALAEQASARKKLAHLREKQSAATTAAEIQAIAKEQYETEVAFQKAKAAEIRATEAIAAEQVAGRAEAMKSLSAALDKLDLDLNGVIGGITQVEQSAITKFGRVTQSLKGAGLAAEQNARVLEAAYTAAFENIESEAARVKLENLGNEAVKEGVISAEQLAEAWRKAADASDLAEQAIQKRTAALQAQQAQEQAELNLRTQLVQLSQAENEAALALARAKGDETEAARLLIEQKRLEVQLSQLRAEALHAEAAAELQQVEAIRQELQATNSLTEAKRAELAAREAAARAKEVEAQIADVVAEKQQRLIQINREVASSTREVEAASRSAGAAGLQMGNQIAAGAQTAAQSLNTLSRGYAAFRNQLSENYGDALAREFEQLSTDVFGNTNVLGAQNEIRDRIRRAEQEYQKAQAERDPDDRYRALRGVNERYLPAAQRAALESTLEAAKEAARASREQSQQQSSTSSSQSRTQPSRTVELRLRTDSGQTASVDVQESQAEGLLSVLEQAGIRSV